MAVQAGNLLWNRVRVTLSPGANTVVSGVREAEANHAPDPNLGSDPSRLMVIPLLPVDPWLDGPVVGGNIDIAEPTVNPATGIAEVVLTSQHVEDVEVNILFIDPHSFIGPVSAEGYPGSSFVPGGGG